MWSAEVHLLRIKAAAREHGARCVIVDPLSALASEGNETTAHGVVERLVDWAKAEDITGVGDLVGAIEFTYLVLLSWLALAGGGAASLDRAIARRGAVAQAPTAVAFSASRS